MTGARGYGNWFLQIHGAWGGGRAPSRRNQTSGQSGVGGGELPLCLSSSASLPFVCLNILSSSGQIGKSDVDGQISLGTFHSFGTGSGTLAFQGTGFRKTGVEATRAWPDAEQRATEGRKTIVMQGSCRVSSGGGALPESQNHA